MKYLDYVGLKNFWNEMNPHVIFYGVCNTLGNVQAKSVTVTGLSEVVEGTRLIVKFVNRNTSETPTIQLYSDNLTATPACPIVNEDGHTISAVSAGVISNYCEFVYDGNGYWVLISNHYGNNVIYTDTNAEPPGEEGMIWLRKKST